MKIKALAIIGFLLILASAAGASECPDIVNLGEREYGFNYEPTRVAVGSDGRLYATDSVSRKLLVYDRNGLIVATKQLTDALGVAVDSSGKVFVGRSEVNNRTNRGEVLVLNKNLKTEGFLGKGLGEFVYPIGITVGAGRVYVTDNRTNQVKYYDATTFQYMGQFSSGLVMPNDIDAGVNGNLYITDRAQQYDPDSGTWGPGAGAHIFTGDGVSISDGSFVTYGFQDQPAVMAVPNGIATDSTGRVFISDSSKGNIQVFDENGGYICDFHVRQASVVPKGMDIGDDGKLYVAATGKIYVLGIDNYVDLQVWPSKLKIEAQQCGTTASKEFVLISNNGPGVLQWQMDSDSPWLKPELTSGEINGMAQVRVGLNVDASGLATGRYEGTITVTSPGAQETVNVVMEVFAPPTLSVSPAALSLSMVGGSIPPAETLNIELSGDVSGKQTWKASADSQWLSVSSSGPSNTLSMASVGISEPGLSGLEGGQYTDNITVSAGCAEGSPAVVPVTFTYVKGGTIKVTANIAEASFTITGPDEYSGSGMSFEAGGVTEGTYSITFGPVDGFKTPDSYSLSVANGGVAEFNGNYMDLREQNNILVSIAEGASSIPDEVRVFDGFGKELGSVPVSSSSAAPTVTASGDLDGDGSDEFVVGHGMGIITGFRADGTPMEGVNFRAFPYKSNIDLALADVDGDGLAEIIVGAGSGDNTPASVRVFKLDGGTVADTGINFLAFQERTGVNVSSGDVDGDGVSEILTALGGGGKRTVGIRIWKVQSSGGALAASDAGGFAAGVSYADVNLAAGDLDADAVDEIVVSSVQSGGVVTITSYNTDGSRVSEFSVPGEVSASIAAGDMDFDGRAEIVAADAVASGLPAVRIYGADGALKGEFIAFTNKKIQGINVSLGRVAGQ